MKRIVKHTKTNVNLSLTTLIILILLAIPAHGLAECSLTSVELVKTEAGVVGADLIVSGSPDIKRAPLGSRQVVYLGGCDCEKGSFSKKAGGNILEKIRWNYHEDENRVHVVFYLTRNVTPQINAVEGRIRVLFPDNGKVAGTTPSPPKVNDPPKAKEPVEEKQPAEKDTLPPYKGSAGPIPPNVEAMMKMFSWRKGCPVPIPKLWLVQVTYFGYDGKAHQGRMVVNKSVAWEVVDIFRDLYKAKFPIQRMELIDEYKGDDKESMAHNNSSAFNCRLATGAKSTYSKHAAGLAVDINPLVNPYVKGDSVLPEQGREYADRSKKKKGMIFKGDAAYQAFTRRGWIWGGSWKTLKDYQHFEKNQ